MMGVWEQLDEVCKLGYSSETVFADFIDTCLSAILSVNDNRHHPDFRQRLAENRLTGIYEDRYMAIVRKYKENENRQVGKRPADHFKKAWIALCDATAQKGEDVLGELYMQHISRGQHGQFFTPSPIADMMSAFVGGADGKTVSDPACGSGRFFISLAKQNSQLSFVGVDISPVCAKMAALNMWLFNLNADIYLGDSLTMKMSMVWRIRKGGWMYEADSQEVQRDKAA